MIIHLGTRIRAFDRLHCLFQNAYPVLSPEENKSPYLPSAHYVQGPFLDPLIHQVILSFLLSCQICS